MKKRILIALLIITSAVACAFGVTACQVGDEHIHDWGEWEITTPAGCETTGSEKRVCKSDAGHTETREIDPLGHLWGDGEITTDPTCEADGVRTFTCERDDSHTKTETETKLGHLWGDGEITTDPTCEADGVRTFTCARDDSHTKTETETKLGHAWNDGEITEPATCTEKGTIIYSCLNNGCTNTKTEEIPALGHKYGEIVSDEIYHWKTCERCNNVSEREEHTFGSNGLCPACGEVASTTGLEFKVNSDMQSFSVVGIGEATSTDIVIPSSYKNLPVTGIAESAFAGVTGLTGVTIPTTITSIGNDAFNGCSSLNKFTWNAIDCNDVGTNVFEGCTALSALTIGAMVNNIPVHTFANCQSVKTLNYKAENCNSLGNSKSQVFGSFAKNVTDLNISANIRNVPDYAFYGFGSVKNIDLPYTVTEIGDYAFYGCESLVSIGTTENATAIGRYAFYNCSNLRGMKISQNLTALGEYSFYGCSELNSSVVLNGITKIEDYTFANCAKLISVTIPDAITEIGQYAFYYCGAEIIWGDNPSVTTIGVFAFGGYKGTSLYIPDSVTEIGSSAFYGAACETLHIGKGVEYLRSGILQSCYRLTDLTVPFVGSSRTVTAGIEYYLGWIFGYRAFQGMIGEQLPDGVMQYRVNNYKYYYQIPDSLTSVTVTDVSSSGEQFNGCSMLKNINFTCSISDFFTDLKIALSICDLKAWCEGKGSLTEPSITELKLNGESITELIIPEETEKMKNYAFTACPYVESIVIPYSVTSINLSRGTVFYGGSCLNSIITPVNILHLLKAATTDLEYTITDQNLVSSASRTYFNGYGIKYNEYGNGCYIGTQSNPYYVLVKINDNTVDGFTAHSDVKIIADGALYGCANLTSISLPFIAEGGNGAFGYIFGTQNYNGSQAVEWNISNSRTTYYMPSSLRSVTLTDVTSLKYAFYNCDMITSVNLSEKITSIGNYAFYNCSGLTDFTLSDTVTTVGNYAFSGCSSLRNISIGRDTSSLVVNAFENCTALETITVSDSNESYSCEDGILYNKAKTQIILVPMRISGKVAIPDTITRIESGTFSGRSELEEITIPNTVTHIDGNAFENCYNLVSVNFAGNSTLKYIYSGAFASCSALDKIVIPASVESISGNAFANCYSLKSFTVTGKNTRIYRNALNGCSTLEDITVATVGDSYNASTASAYTLFGCIFGTSSYTGSVEVTQTYGYKYSTETATYYIPESLKKVTVLNGSVLYGAFSGLDMITELSFEADVTTIDSFALSGCSSLESLTLPFVGSSVNDNKNTLGYIFGTLQYTGGIATKQYYGSGSSSYSTYYIPATLKELTVTGGKIPYGAFYNCSGLTGIIIHDGVTSIGDYAFSGCSGLTGIVIPDGVTSISDYAFSDCSGLTSVIIPDGVTSIGKYAFKNCSGLITVYYKGSAENWGKISISYLSCLTESMCYCYSETEPELNAGGTAYDGNYWHYDADGVTPVVWTKE